MEVRGFRDCQINAINNLEESFALNKPRALIQMATGAGKTFTAITAAYRLLKFGKMNRILFLVDTKSLGKQAYDEFCAYRPNDDYRPFSEIYGVYRLKSSRMPSDVQIYISTIQRMYSILKGEELDERAEEIPMEAFLIGLTATPEKRTLAFFHENIVSEYTRTKAIVDGVNVGEEEYLIETDVTKNGAHITKQLIECRSRSTRATRWKELDDDLDYVPTQLDRDIVNPSQIRAVIREFKDRLFTALFPGRKYVPKTLIFAKNDSHADDIVNIVRDEFGEGNEFCQKITYSVDNPEQVLSDFRTSFPLRIAVTVDMIATGTDVKAIECLIFMRDVRSRSYFEQMKGRGTRTLCKDDLQQVSPDATENKSRFVIVDAVGVTTSKKTETRPLERKPSVSLNELMKMVSVGSKDEDTLTSLANRIIRLNHQMSNAERKDFAETVGENASQVAQNLLDAFDLDVIAARAGLILDDDGREPTAEEQKKLSEAQTELIKQAVAPFHQPEVREYIEKVRRSHEQIIDNVNIDKVLFSGYASQKEDNVDAVLQSFHEFIEENRDEITALGIIYDQRYKDRPMAIRQLKELYEKMKRRMLTVEVSMIRYEMGLSDKLEAFSERVNYNFMQWTLRKNAGAVHFSEEQMEWLRLIKDQIAVSLSIQPDDLDLSPFDRKGGLGRFYEVFGDEYESILHEMNIELVA